MAEPVDSLEQLCSIRDLCTAIDDMVDGKPHPKSAASRPVRGFSIFLCAGALPARLKLLGLVEEGNQASPAYILAQEADLAMDGSRYDKRVKADDTRGRPEWAQGAVVLLSSKDAAVLHGLLTNLGIGLDCRYVVCPVDLATTVFLAMAHAAEAESGKDFRDLERVVNQVRSVTINLDDTASWDDAARRVREAAGNAPAEDDSAEEAFKDPVRAGMDEVIKDKATGWRYQFSNSAFCRTKHVPSGVSDVVARDCTLAGTNRSAPPPGASLQGAGDAAPAPAPAPAPALFEGDAALVERFMKLTRETPAKKKQWLGFCQFHKATSFDPNGQDAAFLANFFDALEAGDIPEFTGTVPPEWQDWSQKGQGGWSSGGWSGGGKGGGWNGGCEGGGGGGGAARAAAARAARAAAARAAAARAAAARAARATHGGCKGGGGGGGKGDDARKIFGAWEWRRQGPGGWSSGSCSSGGKGGWSSGGCSGGDTEQGGWSSGGWSRGGEGGGWSLPARRARAPL